MNSWEEFLNALQASSARVRKQEMQILAYLIASVILNECAHDTNVEQRLFYDYKIKDPNIHRAVEVEVSSIAEMLAKKAEAMRKRWKRGGDETMAKA